MGHMIDSFRGQYRFLSNFYPCKVTYDFVEYPTVEHAYQAAKTLIESERAWILSQPTPGRAKRAGKKITLRKDWDEIKLFIMQSLVVQKFGNKGLAEKLLSTDEEELVEGNTWGDTFWGIYNGVGENHLGKILMMIREELKNVSQV